LEPQLTTQPVAPAAGLAPWHADIGVHTDVGRVRDGNEDRWLVMNLNKRERLHSTHEQAQPLAPLGFLLAVADGMGGMSGGERASQLCLDTLAEELAAKLPAQGAPSREALCHVLVETVRHANARIREEAAADSKLKGMGTTLTAVVFGSNKLSIVQVGDSRCYLVRAGQASQLTRDQTVWETMLASGKEPDQNLARAPWKNMLVQAVGAQPNVEPVVSEHGLEPGDAVVLCSDGLHRVVQADEIAAAIGREPSPGAVANALIALANERGGPDNVTVIVGRVNSR
jgi:protein phosphatase